MDYNKVHESIIKRAKIRNWRRRGKLRPKCYVEDHHIIPLSVGGKDDITNIVTLTAKEHYIVHLLLTKIYVGPARSKMVHALHRMIHGNNKKYSFVSPRVFEKMRIERAIIMSTNMKDRCFSQEHRKKISQSLMGRKFTPEHRKKISQSLMGRTLSESHNENKKLAQTGLKKSPQSIEQRRRHSEFMKGRPSPNKGKSCSLETRQKISNTKKANKNV